MTDDALTAAREAFAGRRWREACELLMAADAKAPLAAGDLELLGEAAYLAGSRWADAWERAHQAHADEGRPARAARCVFWLALSCINEGEMAQAGGWLARAHQLVEAVDGDCAERGFLLVPEAIERVDSDAAYALETFTSALAIARRFNDHDLAAIARHGQSRALIRLSDGQRGLAILDQVFIAVKGGEVSPFVTGDTYCGAIEACHEMPDVGRAREWTAAFSAWCDAQPELVTFRGQCLVYRSSVMQARGAWGEAVDFARQACVRLTTPVEHPAAGAAYYQKAELHRLRGEFPEAEESYRLAAEHGRDAQPGLAQLRHAQGQTDTAAASVRRLLQESNEVLQRSLVLPACVDVMLGAGDVLSARGAARELSEIAVGFGSAFLSALASHCDGAVSIAEGRYAASLAPLRKAATAWRELDAPYHAAATRALIGVACAQLGDRESAALEWDNARRVFEQLGARPDVARLLALAGGEPAAPAGLTARETDILRLVAKGKTNRAIADELVISEKTVARHLSNIFTKIGVSTRSAATAFAYDHGLIQRPVDRPA
jgi:DNA-binding CsgD family transcriptional regulator